MNGSVILQERFKYSKKIIMKKYINLSILTFSLSFIISCINVKDITRVYQKGENAKEKQYYQNKENYAVSLPYRFLFQKKAPENFP